MSVATSATPRAGSGVNVNTSVFWFSSNASARTLYGRSGSPSKSPGSGSGAPRSAGANALRSSTMSPRISRTPSC